MFKFLFLTILSVSWLMSANLTWGNDYNKALKEAQVKKKDIYMLVTSENCRWCRKFEATTLQDPLVLQKLNQKYVLLHIDRDKDYMPEHFKKKRVPRHYFIRNDGSIIYSFLGFWDSEDFISFLSDVDKRKKEQDKLKKQGK